MGRIWADIKEYGMAGIIFVIYYLLVHLFRAAFCPFLNMTGIPCAGCGMTRAFLFVLRGEFARAAYINPMVYVLIGFVLYCGYFRYLKGTKIKGFRYVFGSLVVMMLIFYVVRMYLYFPDRIPYTYMRENVLAKRVPAYQTLMEKIIAYLRK